VKIVCKLGPFDRQVGQAAVAPHEPEDAMNDLGRAVTSDGEAQQRQRIERMLVREFDRDAQFAGLPDDEAVGEYALRCNLGGTLLTVRLQQAREQYWPIADSDAGRK
jgi:hypothetical protein